MASGSELEAISAEVRTCVRCPLHESRKKAVPGEGPPDSSVVIVGEAPGASEDEQGRPFVGSAGKNLDALLERAGLKREEVFITNVVKCRPPGNRRPRRSELDACHPFLRRQLDAIRPRVVVLLGDTALKEFFPASTLAELHGRPTRRGDTTFLPTYHPASIIYNPSLRETLEKDFAALGELLHGGPV
jgi:uracil-DNA glycosylase